MLYTSNEIRKKFLEFFSTKSHSIIPSAPVLPENDPTVLFNTAGMQPIVPYLLGEKHPLGNRLADSQKCIRTNDIEEVGDNRHLTFFEMLGNWSLGDYFKDESISWSWEFLTSSNGLSLDPKKIAVTVFAGDKDAPRDEESAILWEKAGVPKNRISYMGKADNWWAAGDTGPCGPDTEIFYWIGDSEFPPENSNVETDSENWMEIWNNVFMQFNRLPDGKLIQLPNKNVDTGMGLERITATLNGVKTVFDTDVFKEIISSIEKEIGVKYDEKTGKAIRIIADHIRAITIMASDGGFPSNVDQGYIFRRLERRAIRQAYSLGFKGQFLYKVAVSVIDKLGDIYPNLIKKREEIQSIILKEEKQFGETLEKGLKEFDRLIISLGGDDFGKTIPGDKAFKLFDTYGFPIEITEELARERGYRIDLTGYAEAFAKHQELSRTASVGKFKGGLADTSGETISLHTATHLMLAGLRKYLGKNVHQKGSNITPERIRFDFSNEEKVEKDILDKVEAYVNEAISSGFEVELREIPKEQAREEGVEGSFWEKYPEIVKVYTIKGKDGTIWSRELCGGPHVENSSNMGKFKIIKEEASSRGVRRIKAILEK